ncbi:MAG: cytochrome c4 [Gammaproteobacteria bacterium]|nr:cytochrome c4 [Gammaproteobacteria bacterium]
MKKIVIVAALLAGLTGVVHAAGDADAGKVKAASCMACHGADGNSLAATPNFPNLAGQSTAYLYKQMKEFKEGKRKDPTMNAMILPLDDQAMQDVAAFYASQKIKSGEADPALVDAGKAIYKGGIAEIGVPACMGCHGPAGSGNPGSGYPQLASQKSVYLEKQLKDFRTAAQSMGSADVGRTNDASKMMRNAVKRMSDPEIKAVAQYIQGLQP